MTTNEEDIGTDNAVSSSSSGPNTTAEVIMDEKKPLNATSKAPAPTFFFDDLNDVQRGRLKRVLTPSTKSGAKYVSKYSLGCLRANNPLRKLANAIVSHFLFDVFMSLIIVLNAIVLALWDPLDPSNSSWRNKLVANSQLVFIIVFTIEMIIRIVAVGFIGQGSYLSDNWNCLDFFVVVMGWVSFVPGVGNVSALRVFRLLRALRSVATLPSMRIILIAIRSAIPGLLNVCLLVVVMLFCFGMIGVTLVS